MPEVRPSLGIMIRARRLGWGLSKRHGCFLRMSNNGGERSVIELCPINAVPQKKLKTDHRCWWETPEILDMLPWLKYVTAIKNYVVVAVGEHGEITEELT